jgi:hypothetical protein
VADCRFTKQAFNGAAPLFSDPVRDVQWSGVGRSLAAEATERTRQNITIS